MGFLHLFSCPLEHYFLFIVTISINIWFPAFCHVLIKICLHYSIACIISYLSILNPTSSYEKNRKHMYLNSIIFSWLFQLIFVVSLKVIAEFVSSPSKCQRWNSSLPYLVNAKLIYLTYFCMIMICGNEFPWMFLLFF